MFTKNFELENCSNKVKYSIKHDIIPIPMSEELTKAIEYLLWYVPDISSVQSTDNELISNFLYDDFTFDEIMKYMKLEDGDVLITDIIPKYIEEFYTDEICTQYQKIIMTKSSDETKTSSLLRHIRNSIAHGYFNIVDNLLVGFDYKYVSGGKEECKAIFKIKPTNLLDALKNLNTELTAEKLVHRALEKCGYNVEDFEENFEKSDKFDFFVSKGSKKYALQIKSYEPVEEISHKDVLDLIKSFEGTYEKATPVLVINTSFLSEKSKEELLNHKIIILDVKNIKKLLNGRDMLYEIERDRKIKF